jgi:N-acetylneuraminic acid mutarotase
MKWLNDYRMKSVVIGIVGAIVFSGGRAKAEIIWARKTDMPIKRMGHSTSVVSGKIYAIGGWYISETQEVALTRVDEYDPTTDTWTRKADMPTARGVTSAVVVNEKIYVIGGEESPTVEVYDPSTDTWAVQTRLPSHRVWFSSCVVDGIIYVIGGYGSNHLNTVEAYDTTTDTWITKAPMPSAGRSFLATCVVDGLIYAIGGGAPGRQVVEVYDPTTDTWTTKAPMPTGRYGLDAVLLDGKIYAIGGCYFSTNGPIYSTVEVYDPVTDTWTKGVDIPVTTANFSTSVVDGKIYVIGGFTAPHAGNHWILTSAVYANEPIVDFNGDGCVDIIDLVMLVNNWGENYSLCDIGPMPWGDGVVDDRDLIVLAEHMSPEPFAHWKLDETEGMFAVDSAGDNDAVVFGGASWRPGGGQLDGALELNGIDACVLTNKILNPAHGPFSISAWVKGGAPEQVVVSQQSAANWLVMDAEGKLITELKSSDQLAGPLCSETIITNGQWHRIGLVWDGLHRTLYVDGVAVAEDTQPGLEGSQMGLYIGVDKNYAPGTFFSGLIDDIRIYNRAVKP